MISSMIDRTVYRNHVEFQYVTFNEVVKWGDSNIYETLRVTHKDPLTLNVIFKLILQQASLYISSSQINSHPSNQRLFPCFIGGSAVGRAALGNSRKRLRRRHLASRQVLYIGLA